jgi:hypothetical protein
VLSLTDNALPAELVQGSDSNAFRAGSEHRLDSVGVGDTGAANPLKSPLTCSLQWQHRRKSDVCQTTSG